MQFSQMVQVSEIWVEQHSPPKHSRKHWIQLLQNSKVESIKQKRNWLGGLLALVSLSIGGAFAINNFLNPQSPTTPSNTTTTTTAQTVTGDAINYRYGTMQLEITASAGKITNINEIQATTSRGYEQAVPLLHQAALSASSANFGNVSGATFASDAYKQALASAISKLK